MSEKRWSLSQQEKASESMVEWQKAAEQLGLHWQVSMSVKKDIDTCRIVSDPKGKRHEIWLSSQVFDNPELYKADVIHELCHAKISESVDPAFSTIHFSKDCSSLKGKEWDDFKAKASWLYLAWAHVDVWIDDLRHEHWPELTRKDLASAMQGSKVAWQQGQKELLSSPKGAVRTALMIASMDRNLGGKNKDKPRPQSLLQAYDQKSRMLIMELANMYKKLPRLGDDRLQNLAVLEDSVQQAVGIMKLPIKPSMVEEEGQAVWKFDGV
jgi:hypothetical protein